MTGVRKAGGVPCVCLRASRSSFLLAYTGLILESHGLGSSQGSLLICPSLEEVTTSSGFGVLTSPSCMSSCSKM